MVGRWLGLALLLCPLGCSGANKFLYVANVSTALTAQPKIDVYSSDLLTRGASQLLGADTPLALLVVNNSLYASSSTGNVLHFTIDPMTGTLTTRPSAPAGTNPQSLAAVGNTLYVANRDSHSISAFSMGANGDLTPSQTVTVSNSPVNLAVDGPNGLMAAAGPEGVCLLSIAPNTTLTPFGPCGPSVGTVPAQVALLNGILYAGLIPNNTTTAGAGLVTFPVNAPVGVGPEIGFLLPFSQINALVATDRLFMATQGGITVLAPATAVPPIAPAVTNTLIGAYTGLVVAPGGNTLYAANFLVNQVTLVSISNGVLTAGQTLTGDPGEAPRSLAFFPAAPTQAPPPQMIVQLPLLELRVAVSTQGSAHSVLVTVTVDQSPWLQSVGNGASTPPVQIAAGTHQVHATVQSTVTPIVVSYSGACQPNGSITLVNNQIAVCTITASQP